MLVGSVTRWLDYVFNIWPFTTMKIVKDFLRFIEVAKSDHSGDGLKLEVLWQGVLSHLNGSS